MIIISAIAIVLLVLFSGLLSGVETAVVASSPGRMQKLKGEGSVKATIVLKLLKMKDVVISTLLVLLSISNTVCTTIAAGVFISIYGEEYGTIISSTLMSIVIIVFAEVIPKAIAVAHAEKISLYMASNLNFLMRLMTPINFALNLIVRFFCFIFRINLYPEFSGAEELRGVIEHQHQEGTMFKEDRDMLGSILDISDMTISEIMIHRSQMKIIDADLPVKKIVSQALSSSHTRIPMYKDERDNIIGILHIRDLLKSLHDNDYNYNKIQISNFIIQPWFIPDNALVSQQLHEFKKRRSHFAFVVNEYGDLQGLVTLEDVLEEIVGQINDEHDAELERIVKKSDTQYLIEGATSIRDLNRELTWNLPDDEASTLAGLIINTVKRLPEKGESIYIQNLKMTIYKRHRNKLQSILVEVIQDNK